MEIQNGLQAIQIPYKTCKGAQKAYLGQKSTEIVAEIICIM